jgi:endo-1,4-beta-D-glucanase Y
VAFNALLDPSFEVGTPWVEYNAVPNDNLSSWLDETNKTHGLKSLRINNASLGDYGRKQTVTLEAGAHYGGCGVQMLADCINASFVVRRKSDLNVLVEHHWDASVTRNVWTRKTSLFLLSQPTEVEVLVGIGSYGPQSAGSARFDAALLGDTATYFDGSTPDTSTTRYDWAGAANLSRSTSQPITSDPAPYTSWELIEDNQFTTGPVNTSRFYIYHGFNGTNGDGTYSNTKVTVDAGTGHLEMLATGNTIPGIKSNIEQMYGKWEVEAEWDATAGYKPVIFLWPKSNKWTAELDHVEMTNAAGNSFQIFLHDAQGQPNINRVSKTVTHNVKVMTKYTLEWLPDLIRVLVNDVEVLRTTDKRVFPNEAMHLVLQMDVGVPNGHNGVPVRPGYPADPIPPSLLKVNSIKIYKPSTVAPPSGDTDVLKTQTRGVWEGIKHHYIRADGGVMQKEADNKITSEGQAYAAMMALQFNDRTTFDLVEQFSTTVLERRNWKPGGSDNWRVSGTPPYNNDPRVLGPTLMAWDYRVNPFGSNQANTVNDWNFATDAEVDRARALWWAWKRWGDVKYREKALAIQKELKLFGFNVNLDTGKAYLVTDEYQQNGPIDTQTGRLPGHHLDAGEAVFEQNVSYIDIGAFELFKANGNDEWWDKPIAGAKDTYTKVTNSTGGLPTTKGLFPDWNAYLFASDDVAALSSGSNGWQYSRSTDQKYDGFRAPIRAVWAHDWYKDADIPTILAPLKAFYADEWTAVSKIAAEYAHDGTRLSGGYEKSMMTQAAVMVLECGDPSNATAAAIRAAKLDPEDQYATDSTGHAFWRDGPGTGERSYFNDFWSNFFYMREAGLWINWGQTTTPVGGVALEGIDTGTSTDEGEFNIPISLEGLDLGTSDDTGAFNAPVSLEGLDVGTSDDEGDFGDVVQVPPVTPPVQVGYVRWQWLTAITGDVLELTDYVDDAAIQRGLSGHGAPPVQRKTRKLPGQAGQFTTNVTHGVNVVAMKLRCKAADYHALHDVMGRFIDAMDPVVNEGTGVLRRIDQHGNPRDLFCRVVGGLEIQDDLGHAAHVLPLTFEADDPYWYGKLVTQGWSGEEPGSWFPNDPYPALGGSGVLGDITIVTESKVPTWPVWTIVGPGSAPMMQHELGDTLAFKEDAVIADTGRVQIDTRPPALSLTPKTVRYFAPGDAVGVNWFPKLSADGRALWALQPGRNEILATLINATGASYVSVAYRDATTRPQ